jgi:hypothetical protein
MNFGLIRRSQLRALVGEPNISMSCAAMRNPTFRFRGVSVTTIDEIGAHCQWVAIQYRHTAL